LRNPGIAHLLMAGEVTLWRLMLLTRDQKNRRTVVSASTPNGTSFATPNAGWLIHSLRTAGGLKDGNVLLDERWFSTTGGVASARRAVHPGCS
jgi:hypothetical protein